MMKYNRVIWTSNTTIFVSLLCLIFLSPTLLPPVRLEDFVVFSVIAVYLLTHHKILASSKLIFFSLFLGVLFLFSIVSGSMITGVPIAWRDLSFIGLIAKYVALFLLVSNLGVSRTIPVHSLLVVISWIGFLSALVAIAQYFNIAGVNNWLTPFYISQEFYLDKLVGEGLLRRVNGTSFNANHYAFLLVFPLISSALLVLVYRRYRYLILNFLVLAALAATLSRTGIIMALFVLVVVYISWNFKRKRYLSSVIFIAGIILGAMYLWFSELGSDVAVIQRFMSTELDLSGENSIGARLRRWIEVVQWLDQYPQAWALGVGPQKEQIDSIFIDSQYFGFLKKAGMIGLLLILAIELYVLATAFKTFVRSHVIEEVCISLFIMGLIVSLLVAQITIEIVNDTQAIGLLIVVLAFFFSKKKLWRTTREPAAVAIQRHGVISNGI